MKKSGHHLYLLAAKIAVVWILLEFICAMFSSTNSIHQEQWIVTASILLGVGSMFVGRPKACPEVRGFEVAIPDVSVASEVTDGRARAVAADQI